MSESAWRRKAHDEVRRSSWLPEPNPARMNCDGMDRGIRYFEVQCIPNGLACVALCGAFARASGYGPGTRSGEYFDALPATGQ